MDEQSISPVRLGALLGVVGVLLLLLLARVSYLGSNTEGLAAAKGLDIEVFHQESGK